MSLFLVSMTGVTFGLMLGLVVQAVQGAFAFRPPTPEQRLAAIGSTAQLPPALRRAFDPAAGFHPIRQPDAFDWLANHQERGQTFDQFVAGRPNRPDSRRNKLYLLPLGQFGSASGTGASGLTAASGAPALDELRQFAAAFFMMDVRLLPVLDVAKESITQRKNPATRNTQLLTTDILALLKRRLPEDAFALLGITMIDLYPDRSWNFVFGQASLRDRVGVYSFARYDPRFPGSGRAGAQRSLMLRRSCKILAHETSHMFGIEHCIWFHCVENGSNHLAEADSRPSHLCPVDLRKLQWSVGFDVQRRYEKLLEFYRTAGFRDEAQWLASRLQFIAGAR